MVVKANRHSPIVTMYWPPGNALAKAMEVRLAPLTPVGQTSMITMTRPVMVQMIRVSMKVPSMAIMPCCTGWLVRAAAWAMGALPRPASLENTPRATPKRSAAHTVAPANPPAAAVPFMALSMMVTKAPGMASMWVIMTTRDIST